MVSVNFGTVGFGIGIKHLGAVPDDAAPFLFGAGQVTGNIHQIDDRDIEGVAEPDKAGGFVAGVDIQTAGFRHRLVGDNTDRPYRSGGRNR